MLGTLPLHTGMMDYGRSLFIYAMLGRDRCGHIPRVCACVSVCVCMYVCPANTISSKIRLHIMNEQCIHTLATQKKAINLCPHTHKRTGTRTHTEGLVLINLAGGTRHVFPFTSWSVP